MKSLDIIKYYNNFLGMVRYVKKQTYFFFKFEFKNIRIIQYHLTISDIKTFN
jgi:hypothetical protein